MRIRRLVGFAVGAITIAGVIAFAWIWRRAGVGYEPFLLSGGDVNSAVGCWRILDASWHASNAPANPYQPPTIARLDTASASLEMTRSGRAYVAWRLDASGAVAAARPLGRAHNRAYWGRTAVSGRLLISFPTGLGGPAFRFSWPRGRAADTLHGSLGSFSDAPPYFSLEGPAHAVRMACPS
jgi:hypothetical protein